MGGDYSSCVQRRESCN
ncbi:hypothetical protein LINPERHAP1_LOCUS36737 [Linum perenne]